MPSIATLLAGAGLSALAFSLWPVTTTPVAMTQESGPGPQVVRLDPAPFLHRLDGDWQREGRPVDAPVEMVTIPAPVEIMATPVSTGEYLLCVQAGACAAPSGPVDLAELPVTGVSWLDARAYAAWFSTETGESWRLPSDAEWAQAAGSLFRDDGLGIEDDPTNPATRWIAEYRQESALNRERDREIRPVGSLNVNELGVHDIGGAVWEWTSTCLRRIETDASGAILRESDSCGIYIAEGLHRAAIIEFVREPKSGGCSVGVPPDNLGFRLVRDLPETPGGAGGA
ncbi:SUMF1/EgtB/PvdO family nonheme iron enzyme [Pseudogemmobacter humi]|uniref:Formylglycine-generating sulfatase enzyme n=1 Tax=Pseudogemmobacter humi TaxID=2483812 RepID=A0A3P5X569_9RHOB|nr:SUMF1/EgtB/PvdO family nonheme iron enzyme [Pseudogemmobacter humi]VDC29425.1 Formylglycine-generating sulfatase enzyme [Pseudogemmobacter humi]